MATPAEKDGDPRARAWEGLHQAGFEVLRQEVPPRGDLWDIGCGQGAFSKLAMNAGYQVHAVDAEIAQCQVPGIECHGLDLDDAKEIDRFVHAYSSRADVIVALEIIEHLRNPWAFIKFCTEMAKPGGYILLSTPHIESIYSRLLFLQTGQFLMFRDYRKPFGHINPLTSAELESVFDHFRLSIAVKAFPCTMPASGNMRYRLGLLVSSIIRPSVQGDAEGIILMYLLRKAATGQRICRA